MSLRRQLLILVLALMALPVAAWQVAVQIESVLREARQQALVASAVALERAFAFPESSPDSNSHADGTRQGLYVNTLSRPLNVDGYPEDWASWQGWAHRFEASSGPLAMELLLASHARDLYLLLQVTDPSRNRASLGATDWVPGDHLILRLLDGRGLRQYRILASTPGAVDIMPASRDQAAAPPRVDGAWRENADGRGYVVELRMPRSVIGSQLSVAAEDTGEGWNKGHRVGTLDDDELGARALVYRSPDLSRRLARLLPDGARGWVLNQQGWVLASAGEVAPVTSEALRGWQSLLYRALSRDAFDSASPRDPGSDLRLSGPELQAARRGETGVRWIATGGRSVLSSVALPSAGSTILVVEQLGDALLVATNQTAGRILWLTLGVVAVVVIVLLSYASLLSWRVRRLRNAAENAMAPGAPPDVQLPGAGTPDEVGDLARSFSSLLTELRSYNDYLKSLASKLSHELNTPLAVVSSSLENLRDQELSDDAALYAGRAQDGAERLKKILRAMSEANRLEQALETTEAAELDLREIVEACVEAYRGMDLDHQWRVDCGLERLPLYGSADLIGQMIDKLADNARDFAPGGSDIIVSLERVGRRARITVSNTGPLLPEKLQGRIFESLVSTRSNSTGQVHLGLGLHIVRLIAKAHGGQVAARNRADGSGVEMMVALSGAPRLSGAD